jgi:predicted dehydrogenase
MSSSCPMRFGILSAANIANKVVDAMHQSPYVTPVAVAARSLDKAKEFALKNNVPKSYGSYEELIQDPEIDAIYLPIPTTLRAQWAIRAAQAGKHILVDKPFVSAQEVQHMRNVCEDNNVLFMDNTMWMHHTRPYTMMKTVPMFQIEPDQLGTVTKLRSTFNWYLSDLSNIRLDKSLEPYGVLGDLGWYCIGNILFFIKFELPEKVWATADSKDGAMIRCDGILYFSNNRKATFECSFLEPCRQDSEYQSHNTIVRIPDFVLPWNNEPLIFKREQYSNMSEYTVQNDQGITEVHHVESPTQHVELFHSFTDTVSKNPTSPDAKQWGERTFKISQVLDALYQSALEQRVISL